MSTKGCVEFFLFHLDIELLIKLVSVSVETRYFLILANDPSSKQNLKNPTHPFVEIGK